LIELTFVSYNKKSYKSKEYPNGVYDPPEISRNCLAIKHNYV
jgi:hypothetical protein